MKAVIGTELDTASASSPCKTTLCEPGRMLILPNIAEGLGLSRPRSDLPVTNVTTGGWFSPLMSAPIDTQGKLQNKR